MTRTQFLMMYQFKSFINDLSNGKTLAVTQVIRTSDNNMMYAIDTDFTNIDERKKQDFMLASQFENSKLPLQEDDIVNEIKKAHLYKMIRAFQIEDFFSTRY